MRILQYIRTKWRVLSLAVLAATLLPQISIGIGYRNGIDIGVGRDERIVITLGSEALAVGTVDYSFGALNANVQFQLALNALPNAAPSIGGRLICVSATQVNFAALTTVTRAIDNVTIEGSGAGSYFVGDGVTSPFAAGGNNWSFVNARVNVTTAVFLIAMGATTGWEWTNITTTTEHIGYRNQEGVIIADDVVTAPEVNGTIMGSHVTYVDRTVVATDVNGTIWKDILDMSTLPRPEQVNSLTLTVAGVWTGLAKIRIVDALDNKIWPADATAELVQGTDWASGVRMYLNPPMTVSVGQGYKLQFRSTNAGDGAGETLAVTSWEVWQRE